MLPHDTFAMMIDGRAADCSASFPVENPATAEAFAHAPAATRNDLDRAVESAQRAFPSWSATPLADRQAIVHAMADRVRASVDPLMRLLTHEQGKPLADAEREVRRSADWLAAAATLAPPSHITHDGNGRRVERRYLALGVVAAIAPWNYPLLLAMFKVGPALVAGNTVVLKPSPHTPLTTLMFGALVCDLLPPGVLNVISGGDDLGPWLTSHPGVTKVSFTGSTETGRRVMASGAPTLKHLTLELGGNDAAIILEDADIDRIAEPIFWSALRNAGQVCIAPKRIYAHDRVYDRLRDALTELVCATPVGDGSDPGVRIGPLNNREHYARVMSLLDNARRSGISLISGKPVPDSGYFVPLTLVDDPPDNSSIVCEEQFGPVLPMLRFNDDDSVVARANAGPYGLGASVWSANRTRAWSLARQLDCGTVWINEAPGLSPLMPFGGRKQSGLGVEGGTEGLLEYMSLQVLVGIV